MDKSIIHFILYIYEDISKTRDNMPFFELLWFKKLTHAIISVCYQYIIKINVFFNE